MLLVAAAVAAGLVAALLVTLVLPSTYRASGAVILVREGRPPGGDPELAQAVVAAQELLRSRAVADSAVANLKLEATPEELLDDVRVSAEPETALVRLSVDASDREAARRIAQELAEVFTVLYNGRFGPATTASIWEAPQAEDGRISPRPGLNLGIGGALGLLAGLGLVVARRRPRAAELPRRASVDETTPTPSSSVSAPTLEPRLEARVAAVTARELGLARRAAALARRERELAEKQVAQPPPGQPESTVAKAVADEIADTTAPFVLPSPGTWTIGDVERLLAEQAPSFPERIEELGFYVESFRDVAEADGRLPAGVEIVVEDVFAELIDRARSAAP